ncbi:hypothetical protein PG2089B_0210 [Bifidobacterium pseudolongum subsp. globosum]|nr:hypothetical protein PG2115B_0229 [Bifidobacterium pseudolongum subsp. globosum]RYQ06442.1 hypothetical protein PG2114B_0215 [Bifidobacterium pseudolongum subsp. globosum]RYQ13237.1 hypothetical protein PG2089B_0210 [Bifidobacterium pseudolongum subsp. globosum]
MEIHRHGANAAAHCLHHLLLPICTFRKMTRDTSYKCGNGKQCNEEHNREGI